jgi:hypothetical protein
MKTITEFSEAKSEVLAAVDRYLAAFNARDTVAIRDTFNFPHFRVHADGELVRYETPENYNLQSLFSRTGPNGWDHTGWDTTEVVFA